MKNSPTVKRFVFSTGHGIWWKSFTAGAFISSLPLWYLRWWHIFPRGRLCGFVDPKLLLFLIYIYRKRANVFCRNNMKLFKCRFNGGGGWRVVLRTKPCCPCTGRVSADVVALQQFPYWTVIFLRRKSPEGRFVFRFCSMVHQRFFSFSEMFTSQTLHSREMRSPRVIPTRVSLFLTHLSLTFSGNRVGNSM